MRSITILLKPTEECNFRCKYCYHSDTGFVKGRMTIQMFEEIIKKTTVCYDNINITFHGGEPLLMGYDFYQQALSIIDKNKLPGQSWRLAIQTNGFLLNEEYCELFKKYDVSPSISFDGPKELNSLRNRTEEVTNNIVQLRKKGYKINLLGVITKRNIYHLRQFYEFAKSLGCPCKLNPVFKSGSAKEINDLLITPDDYIESLIDLLPIWLVDKDMDSHFDPLTSLTYMALLKKHAPICENCGCLSKWIAISYDGTLYPCSRSYPQEYQLGNIKDLDNLSMAFNSPGFKKLIIGAIERRNYCKDNCDYYSICQGGCNNDSILNGNLARPAGFKCTVYKSIIPFIKDFISNNEFIISNPQVKLILKKYHDGQHNDK